MPGRCGPPPARGSYCTRRALAPAAPPPMPVRGALIGVGIGRPGRPAQYSTPVFGAVVGRAGGVGVARFSPAAGATEGTTAGAAGAGGGATGSGAAAAAGAGAGGGGAIAGTDGGAGGAEGAGAAGATSTAAG